VKQLIAEIKNQKAKEARWYNPGEIKEAEGLVTPRSGKTNFQ
jgi:hypothetical protein